MHRSPKGHLDEKTRSENYYRHFCQQKQQTELKVTISLMQQNFEYQKKHVANT